MPESSWADVDADRIVVSVLMPMRDAGAYLQAAVDSILQQDHRAVELIVIDDGSRDGSRERVLAMSDARIRLIDGPRTGISACLNAGLAHATGAIVMRCDADDLYPPARIRRQVDWLRRHPEAIAVCGAFAMVGPSGAQVAAPLSNLTQERRDVAVSILDGQLNTHLCAFAIVRSALQQTAGFRPYFETAEDIDFVLRLAELGPVGFDPFVAYLYRLHGTSITHTQASVRRRFFETQAREMSRDRRTTGSDALSRGQPPALPVLDDSSGSRPDGANLHMAQLLVGQSWHAFSQGSRRGAMAAAARAIAACPAHAAAWKALLFVSLGPRKS